MTTIKPATPLPWSLTERMTIDANLGAHSFPIGANAAYIVHACNAYPELVAELKYALYLERSKKYAARLQALLAKLGEGA